jgi:hypothetical protein
VNIWVRLVGESVLGAVLIAVGVLLIGQSPDTTWGMVLAVGLLIVGIGLIVDLVLAAAFGRIKTPSSLGAGVAPPGTGAAERYYLERAARDQPQLN